MPQGESSPLPPRIIGTTSGCAFLEASVQLQGATDRQLEAYESGAVAWKCGREDLGRCGLYAVVEGDPDLVSPGSKIESREQLTVVRRDENGKAHDTCPATAILKLTDTDLTNLYERMFDQGGALPRRTPTTKPPENQEAQQEE